MLGLWGSSNVLGVFDDSVLIQHIKALYLIDAKVRK